MKVITGTHQETTGEKVIVNGKEADKMQTVVDTVKIPDKPQFVSDFPKATVAAINPICCNAFSSGSAR